MGGLCMKKYHLLFLAIMFISILFMGCQSNESETESKEISKVSVSVSDGAGEINPDFFTLYEAEAELEVFESAFSSAVRENGVVDIAPPDYDLEVINKHGNMRGYHLWLAEKTKKSTLMNMNDTHTIYYVPEEITNQLIDLISEEADL